MEYGGEHHATWAGDTSSEGLYGGAQETGSYGDAQAADNKHSETSLTPAGPVLDPKYVAELNSEKHSIDPEIFPHALRLVSHEINRVTLGWDKLIDLHRDRPTKVCVKVRVPAGEHPKFNFIGKIIGPKGNTLRRLQEETGCRMAVYGRGSMRDKAKEEELRQQGGKYAHFNEELHVSVESFGHPIDVHRRLSIALHALRRHLIPDYNDEISQSQVQELAYLNGGVLPGPMGRGRGAMGGDVGGWRGSEPGMGSPNGAMPQPPPFNSYPSPRIRGGAPGFSRVGGPVGSRGVPPMGRAQGRPPGPPMHGASGDFSQDYGGSGQFGGGAESGFDSNYNGSSGVAGAGVGGSGREYVGGAGYPHGGPNPTGGTGFNPLAPWDPNRPPQGVGANTRGAGGLPWSGRPWGEESGAWSGGAGGGAWSGGAGNEGGGKARGNPGFAGSGGGYAGPYPGSMPGRGAPF